MSEFFDTIWPLGIMVGALCLLVAFCAKSVKQGEDYMEDAYKWAMWGGILILVGAIIMWIMRVQQYWR